MVATGVALMTPTGLPAHAMPAQGKKSIPPLVPCGRSVSVTDAACQKEIDAWQAGEKLWREQRRLYGNYVTYDGLLLPHIRRPDPPWWVEPYCESDAVKNIDLGPVCRAYDDYLRYDWTQHIDGPAASVTYSTRTSQLIGPETHGFRDFILKNLHYDGPWMSMSRGSRVYGLFGTHLTLASAGRLRLWGPPGMLVVRRPEGKIEVKMSWGVDIFVGDLPIPFRPGYKVPLFVSVAKVFGPAEQEAIQNRINTGLDMVGFSVTIRR